MKLSSCHMPVFKGVTADAVTAAHSYSLRASIVKQVSSGVYSWLPAGTRIIKKICAAIHKEMEEINVQEVIMPILQPGTFWHESGRINDYGEELIKITDRTNKEFVLGPTHEEVATDIARYTLKSYKNLPSAIYQIQWKFRDEIRPKFGIMRTKEFLMKDAYSFDFSPEKSMESYYMMYKSYMHFFRKMGLTPIATLAKSGAIGGDISHEFHIISESGENLIHYDKRIEELASIDDIRNLYARSEDTHDISQISNKDNTVSANATEVGHIFYFGTKYSEKMNAFINNKNSSDTPIFMGSYGIGVSRLVGTLIEVFQDKKGVAWPACVAPFKFCISNLKVGDPTSTNICEKIYAALDKSDVIYNDSEDNIGSKLYRAEFCGFPIHIIVGPKNAAENIVEIKYRKSQKVELLHINEAINKLKMLEKDSSNWY